MTGNKVDFVRGYAAPELGTSVNTYTVDGKENQAVVPVDSTGVPFSDTNPLETVLMNSVSTGNSTETPLGINGVFTGVWVETCKYSNISIMVSSNVASATNGLSFQQSMDGVNIADTDTFTIQAGNKKQFTFGVASKYARVVYTNGGTGQTTFMLQTILHSGSPKPSSHRISDAIVGDDDASLQKSVITGIRDDGVFGNARLDNDNQLIVDAKPYTYAIAESDIAGHTALLKFGTRTAVAAATQSVVWEGPTALYTYMATAQQLKVSSTSAEDGAGGTGILTLIIYGLDANFAEINETVTMNGLTAVTTTKSFIRVFRAFGVTCGSALTNVGTISIKNNAETVTQIIINPTDGQTLMTIWTVPAGKVAYLVGCTFSTDSNKGSRVSIFTRLNDGGTLYPWQIKYRAYAFSGNEIFPFNIPFQIPAKTDIEIRVTTPASAGTTSAGSTFELWYEDV